jgi:hypothetical protein
MLALWVRSPPGAWKFVSCEFCMLSGRGLCITVYRVWRVQWVWSRSSVRRGYSPESDRSAKRKAKTLHIGCVLGFAPCGTGLIYRAENFPFFRSQISCAFVTWIIYFPTLFDQCGWGVLLTTHPLLMPGSRKGRTVPLLTLEDILACNGRTFYTLWPW